MSDKKLSTEPYKGVRDFFPAEMAVQDYIFATWSRTAAQFGFQHYEASVLEPSILYKSKGAENEELVNEQTYTFLDRGDREVTLRPEMTPTVARMIAHQERSLHFPVRWYSIPNLFRYERPQRGRLREHWQLNADIFGGDQVTGDIEIITLAVTILQNFGADLSMFEIRLNDRREMESFYRDFGITDVNQQRALTRLNDRFHKISKSDYREALIEILNNEKQVEAVYQLVTSESSGDNLVFQGLQALGITNVRIDRSLARGFDYYTGTIFELFDTSSQNPRALLGGGRYDNLTSMFSDKAISGVGFGMGDVVMRDFLEEHKLLPTFATGPQLRLLPMTTAEFSSAAVLAQTFRTSGVTVDIDHSSQKIGKKIAHAGAAHCQFIIVIGAEEIETSRFTLKNLASGEESTGTVEDLLKVLR